MKNLSRLFFSILLLTLFIGVEAFAETPVKSAPQQAVVLATVNIDGAKIVSQKDNTFDISFTLSNREGLQTGVKYGIELIKDDKYMVDEKIYDESLTLNPNTSIDKKITYQAPAFLSGEYSLVLTSKNVNGFPFAILPLGKVTLKATATGVQILPETCYVQIVNDKNNTKYNLNQSVEMKPEENLKLTCSVLNSSNAEVSTVPSYETHYYSTYGDVVNQIGGDTTPITLIANEKKEISLILSKATIPQSYNVKVTLTNKGNKSNPVNVGYTLKGTSVTIQNVSLDKDYYTKGEQAMVSFVFIPSAGSYDSKSGTFAKAGTTATVQISDSKGNTCSEKQTKDLSKETSIKASIPVSITSPCANPKIAVVITDEKGTVLDQKDFSVKTSSVPVSESNSNIIYIIIVVVLLIIVIVYIYMKKKKTPPSNGNQSGSNPTSSIPMNIIFPFFLLVALFGLIPISKASADSLSIGTSIATLNIDKGANGSYPRGGVVVVTGSLWCNMGCGSSSINVSTTSSGGGTLYPGSGSYNVAYASTPTSQNVNFNIYAYTGGSGSSGAIYNTVSYTIPFNILPTPVVTVLANGSNSLTVNSGSQVNITWTSTSNTKSCTCTYNGTTSCGSGTSYGGSGTKYASGNPYTLTATTTFSVICTNT